ncbi:UNVERIFIED_CONTAM: hypothetical protein Scaly_2664500 [Sesamum calycinum]|uniref:Uncharacterized protein n=1 Tax=Sesamum calycinum TaxID=2727403 RepID=A0AAW2J8V1_9LAMI
MAERLSIAPSINKPVIVRVRQNVRVRRKAFQSAINAFWLEIHKRPSKRPLLDFGSYDASSSREVKKPAGTVEEVERHFGCESARLIMVGDRPFTDIVYGNRNAFFMILTEPLSLAEEPLIVRQRIPYIGPTVLMIRIWKAIDASSSRGMLVLKLLPVVRPNPSDELKSKEQNEKGRRDIKAWKSFRDLGEIQREATKEGGGDTKSWWIFVVELKLRRCCVIFVAYTPLRVTLGVNRAFPFVSIDESHDVIEV